MASQTEQQRLLLIDEEQELQVPSPQRRSQWMQTSIIAFILGAVFLLAYCTIDPFLIHFNQQSLRGSVQNTKIPALYKAVGVHAAADFTFQRFTVSEGEEVSKDEVVVLGEAHGQKMQVKAGFDGLVAGLPSMKQGDLVTKEAQLATIAVPNMGPLGAVGFLLLVSLVGTFFICIGMEAARHQDLTVPVTSKKTKKTKRVARSEEQHSGAEFKRAELPMPEKHPDGVQPPSLPRLWRSAHA